MEQSNSQKEKVAPLSSAQSSALQAPSECALRVPSYCEENVWRLAYRRIHGSQKRPSGKYYVVFVSNEIQCVPMFYQLAKDNPHQLCGWDYHVILLWTPSNYDAQSALTIGNIKRQRTVVLDMDSHLQYPCPLDEYLIHSFPLEYTGVQEKFAPMFRIVEATLFLEHFCSDRMHMFNAETQEWLAPPPKYDCIQTDESQTSNLQGYINMKQKMDEKNSTDEYVMGTVLSLEQLRTRFCDS